MTSDLFGWEPLEAQIIICRRCPRLVAWREETARVKRRAYRDEEYWGRPVPGFGDRNGLVLVVGLAPGAHGANRTGRMFTGDSSGDFLYAALYRAGFANQPTSRHRGDGLALHDLFISAACRCAPPDNKPTTDELAACLPYLQREIGLLERLRVIVALGRIAFDAVLRAYATQTPVFSEPVLADGPGKTGVSPQFAHGAVYTLGDGLPTLVASYHPSRQNTQTGRLTQAMFDDIWATVKSRGGFLRVGGSQ